MNQRYEPGARVIVIGRDGMPDRAGTVRGHVNTSVWVEYDHPLPGQRTGEWWWEAHVRPESEPMEPKPEPRPEPTPDDFEANVRQMRHFQRLFFQSKVGSEARKNALEKSKRFEHLVDAELARREVGQERLF